MHTEILDEKRLKILHMLCDNTDLENFYMGGGTAISLQLKLRKSEDFDFFTHDPFNEHILLKSIEEIFPDEVRELNVGQGTCDILINEVQCSFFQYPYPMCKDPIKAGSDFPGLYLACIDDLAVMKLAALGGRSEKKDFFDLYQIYKRVDGFNTEKLICGLHRKFGEDFDPTYMIMGSTYFDTADKEILPEAFVRYSWKEIRSFFMKEQQALFDAEERFCNYGFINASK